MKKLLLIFFTMCLGFNAYAFNFTNYTPTLDRLYADGQSTINSGYSISFTPVTTPGSNAVTIYEWIGGMWTPRYRNYTLGGNGSVRGTRVIQNTNTALITGYFRDITLTCASGDCNGAAILNNATIDDIYADFINNTNFGTNIAKYDKGGAIANFATIRNIYGDFIGNNIRRSQGGYGGAIYNEGGTINNITGNFAYNHIAYLTNQTSYGGAIANINATGPYRLGRIDSITGDFIGNYIWVGGFGGRGGAIYNEGTIGTISGNFIDNFVVINNTTAAALGGAIYTMENLTFLADGNDYWFRGNYTQRAGEAKNYNAIYAAGGKTLTFNTINNGSWIFEDNIDGGVNYIVSLTGDGTGKTVFKNDIINAGSVNITNSTLVFNSGVYGQGRFVAGLSGLPNLSLNNGIFDIANGYIETINLKSLSASNDSYIYLDLNPATLTADKLAVDGNITGTIKLVVNALSDLDLRESDPILFATATGVGSATSFEIFRVYGSPFLFDINFVDGATKQWLLAMNNTKNTDYTGSFDYEACDGPTPGAHCPTGPNDDCDGPTPGPHCPTDPGDDCDGPTPGAHCPTGPNDDCDGPTPGPHCPTGPNDDCDGPTPGPHCPTDPGDDCDGPTPGAHCPTDPGDDCDGPTPGAHCPADPTDPTDPTDPGGGSVIAQEVYPEVMAYVGMQSVMLSQTMGILDIVINSTTSAMIQTTPSFSFSDNRLGSYSGDNRFGFGASSYASGDTGIWLQPVYSNIKNKNIVSSNTNVAGVAFGVQKSFIKDFTTGLFGSLSYANSKLDGDGEGIYSTTASTLKTNSMLFGGYAKYSPGLSTLFISAYGGTMNSALSTGDGLDVDAKASVMGLKALGEYGFDVGGGFSIAPGIGLGYNQIAVDNIKDDVGKTAEYNTLRQIQGDVGFRFKQSFENKSNVYLRPSYMLTSTSGNKVDITGLGEIETVKDMGIMQIELGGDLVMADRFTGNAFTKYSTGSDYSNFTIGAGFLYKF
ncbi:MAG: autotransporter domain-containing protein [Alphaproteobacteria bacterium]|nr:autotransporter domain-containing protein [Alphaproteobacteria bacterium]